MKIDMDVYVALYVTPSVQLVRCKNVSVPKICVVAQMLASVIQNGSF